MLIAVMSYLFIDESRRGDPVLFRPAPLINAYLALLKTSCVMFHGLTSGLAVGIFFAMGGATPYAFDRMAIGPLEYGLLTPLLLSFLCFSFGVCNGLVIANAMICSLRAAGRNSGAGTGLLGAMQMLFGGVAESAIIALGGADYFSVTATGLLIMSLCAVLSSFLAPNSR